MFLFIVNVHYLFQQPTSSSFCGVSMYFFLWWKWCFNNIYNKWTMVWLITLAVWHAETMLVCAVYSVMIAISQVSWFLFLLLQTQQHPWDKSFEYLLVPVTTEWILLPFLKNSVHIREIFRGRCPTISPSLNTDTAYISIGFPCSCLHCNSSPTAAAQLSL